MALLTAGPFPDREITKITLYYAPMHEQDQLCATGTYKAIEYKLAHRAGDPLDPRQPHRLMVVHPNGTITHTTLHDGWSLAIAEQMMHGLLAPQPATAHS